MGISVETIKSWLNSAEDDDTHMIVICDTFDYIDYPKYVKKTENVRMVYDSVHQKNMQKVMEVYNLKMDIDDQLNERRAFNF